MIGPHNEHDLWPLVKNTYLFYWNHLYSTIVFIPFKQWGFCQTRGQDSKFHIFWARTSSHSNTCIHFIGKITYKVTSFNSRQFFFSVGIVSCQYQSVSWSIREWNFNFWNILFRRMFAIIKNQSKLWQIWFLIGRFGSSKCKKTCKNYKLK